MFWKRRVKNEIDDSVRLSEVIASDLREAAISLRHAADLAVSAANRLQQIAENRSTDLGRADG